MGVSPTHKGHKCMNMVGRIFISKDVVFNEEEFPFKTDFKVEDQNQVRHIWWINLVPNVQCKGLSSSDQNPLVHTTNSNTRTTTSIQLNNHHDKLLHDRSNMVPSSASSNSTIVPCSNPIAPPDVSHVSDNDVS